MIKHLTIKINHIQGSPNKINDVPKKSQHAREQQKS